MATLLEQIKSGSVRQSAPSEKFGLWTIPKAILDNYASLAMRDIDVGARALKGETPEQTKARQAIQPDLITPFGTKVKRTGTDTTSKVKLGAENAAEIIMSMLPGGLLAKKAGKGVVKAVEKGVVNEAEKFAEKSIIPVAKDAVGTAAEAGFRARALKSADELALEAAARSRKASEEIALNEVRKKTDNFVAESQKINELKDVTAQRKAEFEAIMADRARQGAEATANAERLGQVEKALPTQLPKPMIPGITPNPLQPAVQKTLTPIQKILESVNVKKKMSEELARVTAEDMFNSNVKLLEKKFGPDSIITKTYKVTRELPDDVKASISGLKTKESMLAKTAKATEKVPSKGILQGLKDSAKSPAIPKVSGQVENSTGQVIAKESSVIPADLLDGMMGGAAKEKQAIPSATEIDSAVKSGKMTVEQAAEMIKTNSLPKAQSPSQSKLLLKGSKGLPWQKLKPLLLKLPEEELAIQSAKLSLTPEQLLELAQESQKI